MKVLFLFGGMPHYLPALLNAISKKGVDVNVVIPSGKSKTVGQNVKMTKEGIYFNLIELKEYKTIYQKYFFKKINSVIKEIKPDIIVMVWPYMLSLFFKPAFLFLLKQNNIKIIIREIPFQVPPYREEWKFYRDNYIFDENHTIQRPSLVNIWAMRRIRKFYYSHCDATVNYCDIAVDIIPTYGVARENIFVCDNTPDTDALFEAKERLLKSPPVLPENRFRMLHVGRLVKWKRVDMLIRVAAKLKNKFPDTELVIVGDGPEENNLRQLAREMQIEDSLIWTGALYDYDSLGKYFMVSTVYVLAGYGGLSINEAMGFGKPVICSVADGTEKKLVRHNYNGLYFKDGDEQSLFEQLDYLFTHPEKIGIFSKNSVHIIKEEINLRTVADCYVSAFKYVLGQ